VDLNVVLQLSTLCFIPKIFAVKFAAKLRSRRKTSRIGSFLAPKFLEEGVAQILDLFFETWLTFEQKMDRKNKRDEI